MNKIDVTKAALASLHATAAAGVFAAGLSIVPAQAAVDGFQHATADDVIYGCGHSQSHSQITCDPQ